MLKKIYLFFFLGSVRDSHRGVCSALLREKNLCLSAPCWPSLGSLWRFSTGPPIPELLLTEQELGLPQNHRVLLGCTWYFLG